MITYDYHCDANGETVTVSHSIKETLRTWGEICSLADHCMGETPPHTPIRRLIAFDEPKPDESTLSMFSKSKSQWQVAIEVALVCLHCCMQSFCCCAVPGAMGACVVPEKRKLHY